MATLCPGRTTEYGLRMLVKKLEYPWSWRALDLE